jgi:DNA-binding LacI/PurR family transcriptional regulator
MDGHELGETFGLTTIDQDPCGQGALAARTALQLLEPRDGSDDSPPAPEADQEFRTEFVIRTSTAVPRDEAGRQRP